MATLFCSRCATLCYSPLSYAVPCGQCGTWLVSVVETWGAAQ